MFIATYNTPVAPAVARWGRDRTTALTTYLVLAKLRAMTPATAQRLTADERRDAVIAAAIIEFAARGYAGTSTMAIARRVGVSQPYLFQLYATKEDLFLATVRACFDETRLAFEQSGRAARDAGASPIDILDAMGHTYMALLADRNKLRLQLQAYAACGDPAVQTVVHDEWQRLYETVTVDLGRRRGADPPLVRRGDAAQRGGVDR